MFELPPPQDDGLLIPTVGDWSRDKHHFLIRYIDGFTTSMKNQDWSGLHYIDLFAGAGIEQLETSKELDWGSPMIAAQAPNPFDGLHFCENDPEKYQALRTRIERLGKESTPQILHGDANELIHKIIKKISPGSLSLAFLDPYGLHLHYGTLKTLSKKRVDLIIFFPDRIDALRNCWKYYLDNPYSNLDRVLNTNIDWRSKLNQTPKHRWAEALRDLYKEGIRQLGYEHFDYERISTQRGNPLYLLIFCSRHKFAAKLWSRTARKKPDSQTTFDFGAPE